MRLKRSVLGFVLTGAMLISMTGCGGPKSAESVLKQAMEQSNKITSMNAKIEMEMEMVVGMDGQEQRATTTTVMDISMLTQPLKMHMEINVAMDGQSQNMTIYSQESDGSYLMYINGGTWTKQEVELADIEQYNAVSNLDFYLESSAQLEEAGSETINGCDTYKYSGIITGEDMREVMETSGAMESLNVLSSVGISQQQIEEIIDGLDSMPVIVWIDKESFYPVRYEMDMSQMMDGLFTGIFSLLGDQLSGLTMNVPTMKMTMDCSDFNQVKDFEIPAEALAA